MAAVTITVPRTPSPATSYQTSAGVLPFRKTARIASAKYRIGLNYVMNLAQSGMEAIGVNIPLISMKITAKNHITNIACWALLL